MPGLVEKSSLVFAIVFYCVLAGIFVVATVAVSVPSPTSLNTITKDIWDCPDPSAHTYAAALCQGPDIYEEGISMIIGPFVTMNNFLSVGISFLYEGNDGNALVLDADTTITHILSDETQECTSVWPKDIVLENDTCFTIGEAYTEWHATSRTKCEKGHCKSIKLAEFTINRGEYFKVDVKLNSLSRDTDPNEIVLHPYVDLSFATSNFQSYMLTTRTVVYYLSIILNVALFGIVIHALSKGLRLELEFAIFWVFSFLLPLMQLPIVESAVKIVPIWTYFIQIFPVALFGALFVFIVLVLLRAVRGSFEFLVTSQVFTIPKSARRCIHLKTVLYSDKFRIFFKHGCMAVLTFLTIQMSILSFNRMSLPSGSMYMQGWETISFLFTISFLVIEFVWIAYDGCRLIASWVFARKIIGTLPHTNVQAMREDKIIYNTADVGVLTSTSETLTESADDTADASDDIHLQGIAIAIELPDDQNASGKRDETIIDSYNRRTRSEIMHKQLDWQRILGLPVGPLFKTTTPNVLVVFVFLMVFSIIFLIACATGGFSVFAVTAGLSNLGYMGIFSIYTLVLGMTIYLAPF